MHLNGQVLEECNEDLRFPKLIHTLNKMKKDAAIAPAVELVENMISRVPWVVKIPEGYEEELKDKAKYLTEVVDDMEHPFYDFLKQASTFNSMGFSLHEKVLRERRREQGSRYDDGLVGIRKLAPRGQDTVARWDIDQNGNLKGLWQKTDGGNNEYTQGADFVNTKGKDDFKEKYLRRRKFLHFRNSPEKNSPVGKSPLVGAFVSWKYKVAYQEMEASGVVQETNGLKVLYLPAKYMTEDATPQDKKTYQAYQNILSSMHLGKSSGLTLPLITDERGNKMFEMDVKNITGTSSFDIDKIIGRYTLEILTSLFADFLTLGSKGGGSFSLAESKIAIIQQMIESRLGEIKAQLNHDLVRHLFELNGWSTEVMPYFDFGEIKDHSLNDISSWIQRVKATGMLPITVETVNWVLGTANIPYRVPTGTTQEELMELLGIDEEEPESKSGEGLNTPSGGLDGTSTGAGSKDKSISNTENK